MSREIKFRGKRFDTGGWVYGDLCHTITAEKTYCFITPINGPIYQVGPETVGEYTGLRDKNEREIYEGDICRYWMDGRWKTGYITWQRGGFAIHVLLYGDEKMDHVFEFQHFIPTPFEGDVMEDQFEVIGNIYENPELLKAGNSS